YRYKLPDRSGWEFCFLFWYFLLHSFEYIDTTHGQRSHQFQMLSKGVEEHVECIRCKGPELHVSKTGENGHVQGIAEMCRNAGVCQVLRRRHCTCSCFLAVGCTNCIFPRFCASDEYIDRL